MTTMLPKGTFRARAVDGELGFSSTNKEQVAVRFQISEGEHEGTLVGWYGYFNTPENAKRTMESLRYCGWTGDDVTNLEGISTREVELVIEHDTYQGRTRAKVRWVNAIGQGPMCSKKLDDGQRKAFAARMKGLAVASRKLIPKREDDYPADWDQT